MVALMGLAKDWRDLMLYNENTSKCTVALQAQINFRTDSSHIAV
ncbi:hypothetical protein POX_f08209 [Penicillium oxalicum]|nr:hypothetical protein POX_f08209 [Penicillium oxalicum]KAI2787831.1 hypothetical protein POX_f08209 [Penicillium oxalicum]